MIVAKYADGITLLPPVDQVWRIERLSPYKRNANQKKQQETFASLFRKALKENTTVKNDETNGFNVLC